MAKRFLTVPEMMELRLMQFDRAVAEVRSILADMDYLNKSSDEYAHARYNIQDAENEIWALKNVAVKVMEVE